MKVAEISASLCARETTIWNPTMKRIALLLVLLFALPLSAADYKPIVLDPSYSHEPSKYLGQRELDEVMVAIPDAFFKIIVREVEGADPAVLVFIYPQRGRGYKKSGGYDRCCYCSLSFECLVPACGAVGPTQLSRLSHHGSSLPPPSKNGSNDTSEIPGSTFLTFKVSVYSTLRLTLIF